MKRVLGHGLAGLTLVGGAICAMAACSHNDSSLFVQDVIYPTPVAAGQSCTYSPDPNGTFLPIGTLDIVFRDNYQPFFLLGNQLVAQANASQLQTETSTINIEGATVRDTDSDGTVLDNYTTLTSATVYPSSGTVPGYAATAATIASQTAVRKLVVEKAAVLASNGSTTLVTYTKFYGHTLGGTYVESNEFEFPIEVCNGCRINFETLLDCNGTKVNGPNCLGTATNSASLPYPCVPGQDTYIDCTQCQGVAACGGAYPTGTPAACAADAGTD
jgi:hypothetical protein